MALVIALTAFGCVPDSPSDASPSGTGGVGGQDDGAAEAAAGSTSEAGDDRPTDSDHDAAPDCGPEAQQLSWPAGWSYCRTIVITGPVPAGYAHELRISETYLAGGRARGDLADLRFREGDCGTDGGELPYWVERIGAGTDHLVWIQSQTKDIRALAMYYGNPAADPLSDPRSTFTLFDDFSGTELDFSNWTEELGKANCSRQSVSVAGGRLTLDVASTAAGDKGCDRSVWSLRHFFCGLPGTLVDFRGVSHPHWRGGVHPNGIYRLAAEGLSAPPGTGGDVANFRADEWGSGTSLSIWSQGTQKRVDTTLDATQAFDVSIGCIAGEVSWFVNGQPQPSYKGATPAGNLNVLFHVASWDHFVDGSKTSVDEVRVRPYVRPEPALAIGDEQAPPDGSCP